MGFNPDKIKDRHCLFFPCKLKTQYRVKEAITFATMDHNPDKEHKKTRRSWKADAATVVVNPFSLEFKTESFCFYNLAIDKRPRMFRKSALYDMLELTNEAQMIINKIILEKKEKRSVFKIFQD